MNAQGFASRPPARRRFQILTAATCVAWVLGPSAPAADSTVNLVAVQCQFDRLGPDVSSETAPFEVDEATLIRVEITSSLADLTTSVVGPGDQVIDPATVVSFGGEYSTLGGDAADSFLIIPSSQPGFHHIYLFPSLGIGTYTVHFAAGAALGEDVPVITELLTDSPVVAALTPTEPAFPVDFPVVQIGRAHV